MGMKNRLRRLGQVVLDAGVAAVEIAKQQPEIKRRIDDAHSLYQGARQVVSDKFEEIEGELWEWIQELQDQAQYTQRQVQRARDASDYYKTLGLEVGATQSEIKAAWRRKMHENHPDKFADNPQEEAAAHRRAQDINLAYQELTALITGREHRRA